MVVDDAWREQDLRPFLQAGRNTTRLITTRRDDILPSETVRQPVDAMQEREALTLLAVGLPPEQVVTQRAQLEELAARLGEWALLLKLVNGFLGDRVAKKQPLAQAIIGVKQRLDEKGLAAFDARSEADRNKAVARTIGVSLALLDPGKRARFGELAVFPEDADVPIGIVALLWAETGSLDAFDTEDFLSELFGLSLLLGLDFDKRTVRLHDTVRHFLQDQAGKPGLTAQHQALVRAITTIDGSSDVDALTQRYYYLWLPYHLAAAEQRDKLDALLLDPGWLQAKLAATGSPQALVADYERPGLGEAQRLLGRTLRLVAGICARNPPQLIPQLLGRLTACQSSEMSAFLSAARRRLVAPAIITQCPTLTPPGAEIARLEGHSSGVNALCVLPDGRLASGSMDNTIRLWDVETSVETARFWGHMDPVRALCMLPDGRLASGSDDETIRLWDLETGTEIARIEVPYTVWALCSLPDGRLASVSDYVRIWDVETGTETARLEGHAALCVLPDGRLASSCWDNTIRLWDVKTGTEIACYEGHTSPVRSLCVLPDGRLASAAGSYDNTIRLWDVKTGTETARVNAYVYTLCLLPDGHLASGASDDPTIRLWDVKTGTELARLEGHLSGAVALCVLLDGRLASGSWDNTIRLWDVKTGAVSARFEGHTNCVNALCLLPNGRLVSGSSDRTIRLWDVKAGAEIARFEGHSVNALCVLPDGRLAPGSADSTIRLWDVKTGAESARFKGHTDSVNALCVLPDGRLASASYDSTICVWDVATGAQSARLKGHDGSVSALCLLRDGRLASGSSGSWENTIWMWDLNTGVDSVWLELFSEFYALYLLPDGRLASGSGDHTIRLWDVETGTETARLEGHSNRVLALCVLPDGRLASGSGDKTIRLWDIDTRREITRLEFDAPVRCLAALPDGRLVAGDDLGRLHWLEIVD